MNAVITGLLRRTRMSTRRNPLLFLLTVAPLAACQGGEVLTAPDEPGVPPPAFARPSAPSLTWWPSPPVGFGYNFGDVQVGQTRTVDFTLMSVGGPARGLEVYLETSLSQLEPPDITAVSNTCGKQLRAETTCAVTIQFRPTLAPNYTEMDLRVRSRNATEPGDVRIVGVGSAPQ